MEMPLGTNSLLAPLANRVYGGGLNIKGEIFSQPTRLIIFGRSGRQISVHRVIFGLIIVVNLEKICFNICQILIQNTGIKNVRVRSTAPNN